jgi:hypothetical protein
MQGSTSNDGAGGFGTVRVFRQIFTPEDAIGSYAFLSEGRSLTSWHCKLRPNTEGLEFPNNGVVNSQNLTPCAAKDSREHPFIEHIFDHIAAHSMVLVFL